MARSYKLQVRLTDQEKKKLEFEAANRSVSMSEVVKDFIKQLPEPPKLNDSTS